MKPFFTFKDTVFAACDPRMMHTLTEKLWYRFCLNSSSLALVPGEENAFCIGVPKKIDLPANKEYAVSVEENGVYVIGRDYSSLMRGYFALLMKIEQNGDVFQIECREETSRYLMKNRMIHICVFPENDLYFIKKLIRLSALCQYTHIIIEFWGMLKYDCLKELSWPNAFSKDEARELIEECRMLGVEPIPMFNQLGHASASRVCYGKHVVLDQNPKLQRLFTPDGWAWNIASDEVKALLKRVREELYALFGEGEYMHVGCDEAYYITRNAALRRHLPDYLKDLTHEVEAEGRRPMLWMDMLLEKDAFKDCYSSGEKDEIEEIRNSTAKSTVFVDWQYGCVDIPVPSLLSLKDCSRDVMGAPWFDEGNYTAHVQTVAENGLFGVMLTTWHLLKQNMPSILGCAKKLGAAMFYWSAFSGIHEETATLLRRLSFEGNTYEDCGWSKKQIEV